MKIRNQLFFILMIAGVTVTLIISMLIFTRGKRIILDQTDANLEAISQTKKTRLENIIRNHIEMLELIASSPYFMHHMEQYLFPKKGSFREGSDTLLKSFANSIPGMERIYISDIDGKIVACSDSNYIGKNLADEESFKTVNKKGEYLDGFFYNKKGELCLTGAVEIKDRHLDKKIGNLFIDRKADDFIGLTNDYTGLGSTGETILAELQQQPVILTPTRYNAEAALNIKIPRNDPNYAINLALEGKEGVFKDVLDYRQEKTIASLRYLENPGWALVTKIDKVEAFRTIDMLRNFLILLNAGFIVFFLLTSYFLGRYLARPVEDLLTATDKFKDGDYTTRIKYNSNNELKLLAESINSMADGMERKMHEMDKMGYILSHDLRAPLNSMISLVDFIREDNKGNLNEETEKMLEMIREKTHQMQDLIRELMGHTKSDKIIKENVDVEALVSTIISHLNPDSHVQIFIQHNLPIVLYHKISLMQVFQNLIHNAVKYNDKDKGSVNIGYSDEKADYRFWVEDNGPGLKEDIRQWISGTGEGTVHSADSGGLGLSVARKIIEENRGKIWAQSKQGEGCTFYFTIPKI